MDFFCRNRIWAIPNGRARVAIRNASTFSGVTSGRSTSWLEDTETILEAVEKDLAACADRRKIFLTSAGVLSPRVSLEKARTVADGLKSLPVN